ncbi:hypothetical protein FJT64_017651 [Amphibalanus amphitrite]|uniref:C3H1-type domain-containing protein n=1 Tax=Amphibalanus amphitrite TaxID=1232801 RepID=A0A6A4WXD1_AMPAM|nr:hypothetical protein FJT64_017651 [Amphibalanus amphitrite]
MSFARHERQRSGQQQTARQLPDVCNDYNRKGGCTRSWSSCHELHLCTYFLQNRCTDERCNKAHALETPRNILLLEGLGWQGSDDLALALDILRRRARGQATSICVMYNEGICNVPSCGRLHICYRRVVDTCPLDDCGLSHDLQDGGHNADLLASAGLTDTPVTELLRRLQEQVRRRPPQPALCRAYVIQGCQGYCLRLHYCEAFLYSRCSFGDRCSNSHSLKESHNRRVLTFFGWTEEQVLEALRKEGVGRSASRPARARTPTERDDEERFDRQDLCEGSQRGPSAETPVKRIDSAKEVANHIASMQTLVKELKDKDQQRETKVKAEEENKKKKIAELTEKVQSSEKIMSITQQRNADYQRQIASMQTLVKELKDKDQQRETKVKAEEENKKKKIAELTEKVQSSEKIMSITQQRNADYQRQIASMQTLVKELKDKDQQRETEVKAEEENKKKNIAELTEKVQSSEKIMPIIQQRNADYQRQIASMQTLVKELKDKDQQRETKVKAEEENKKKNIAELTEKVQSSEKIMSITQQRNADYQRQIAIMQTLVKELKDKDQQRETEVKAEEENKKKKIAELTEKVQNSEKIMAITQERNGDYQRQIASMQTLVKELKDKDQQRETEVKAEEENKKKKIAELTEKVQSSEKIMAITQQRNADYQRQIASMQTLVKELKDKDEQRETEVKAEEENKKKKIAELTEKAC